MSCVLLSPSPSDSLRARGEQARRFWFGLINYERRSPQQGELKLDRTRRLLHALGNPQDRLRLVHVAGSKGKGSTSAMLASIFRHAGYRTGLFTSPHLCQVNERFQVDGQPISDTELDALLDEVRHASLRLGLPCQGGSEEQPTFFEVATAVGFLHFVRRRVDLAVIEVGLGGRLDSTNVCQPLASLITSISFDHVHLLGDRLVAIAREKAGIIKPGRPCISGVAVPEARVIIEQTCADRHAPLIQIGQDFHPHYEPGCVTSEGITFPYVQVHSSCRTWPRMQMGLLGEHQASNAAVALACVEQLQAHGLRIADAAVCRGLAEVYWPARLEVVRTRPLVVLDCAHNVASAQALADTMGSSFPEQFLRSPSQSRVESPASRARGVQAADSRGPLSGTVDPSGSGLWTLDSGLRGRAFLIFAGSQDKDVRGMFRVLAPLFRHAFLTRYTDNPRSVPTEELVALWQGISDVPVTSCATPEEAYWRARALAGPEDLICITGSVFLAGELLSVERRESRRESQEPEKDTRSGSGSRLWALSSGLSCGT
jgi:dihydrofolate synthase/folylpolyglutamate synthase